MTILGQEAKDRGFCTKYCWMTCKLGQGGIFVIFSMQYLYYVVCKSMIKYSFMFCFRFTFLCDKWLAVEQDDGMVERIISVTSHQTLTSYDQLISDHARFNATENHLWLSMIIRPQQSTFTRVQRLTCAYALLFLTMITSCMFFRTDNEVRPNQVSIGIIKFSLTTLYVSFISILIATVPIFIVTFIFKKSRPKETSNSLDKKKNDRKPFSDVQNEKEAEDEDVFMDDYFNFYKEERLPLPHGMVYVGWTILVLAIVSSGFFVILYSMEFGKTKSEEWLSTFVFSFVESLFVLDPINVRTVLFKFNYCISVVLLFSVPIHFLSRILGDCHGDSNGHLI